MDGKKVAALIERHLRDTLEREEQKPSLGILLVGDDPASIQYVRTKEKFGTRIGVVVEVIELPVETQEADVVRALEALSERHHGVIVQLPLPLHCHTKTIFGYLPREKDVDVLTPSARDAFVKRLTGALLPPVPLAVLALLDLHGVSLLGRRTVIVGRGKLVGEPVGIVLGRRGAELAFVEKGTADAVKIIEVAEIIIAGVGVPHLITPDMIADGAIVIDAGTSEARGKLVGDVDPRVAEKASLFAPVPGGLGPVTVAMLFVNLLSCAGIFDQNALLQELTKKASIDAL